jgi:hypothetical protein
MNRAPSRRRRFAILALALFVAWLGAGVLHHHAPTPDCQFCKVVPGGVADLTPIVRAPAPAITLERIAPAASDSPAERLAAIPRGRAPPTA